MMKTESVEWYNAPHIGYWTKKPLNNKKLLCEYWSLKSHPNVVVVGTELQLYNLFSKMLEEEGWQTQLDWAYELLPEYIEAYKNNKNKPLIINLKELVFLGA